jgi:hypothetical protein
VAVVYKFVAAKDFDSELETGDSSWMNNLSDVITVSADSLFVKLYAI